MTEEQKEKYREFVSKISEILGLEKPVDVVKLCVVTNHFFKPLQNQIKDLQKQNEDLQKQISILLSCKNCPDNKGGYVCDTEYNDKCLAQKIQYIKELQEENEKLKTALKTVIESNTYANLLEAQKKAKSFLEE